MPIPTDAAPKIKDYFRSKTKQLLAESLEPVSEHNTLKGQHREAVVQVYLEAILPRRFAVGSGMVYGPYHRSKQADVVIWDAMHYPQLTSRGHTLFFAESVRSIIEVKSQWSSDEFVDVMDKVEAASDIVAPKDPSIDDVIRLMQMDIEALRVGEEHQGFMHVQERISTAAIFFYGGESLRTESLDPAWIASADDRWPDVLLLLGAGKVVLKDRDRGEIIFCDVGDEALLIFTDALLRRLVARSVYVEAPLDLHKYIPDLAHIETDSIPFRLTRLRARRYPI